MTGVDEDNESIDASEGDDEFSIEQLGAAYARVIRGADPNFENGIDTPGTMPLADQEVEIVEQFEDNPEDLDDEADDRHCPVSEESIVEAALFVGTPEGEKLTSRRLAGIMRDVSPKEIKSIVERLNQQYEASRSAWRIYLRDGGYQIDLIPEMKGVRDAFLGEVREAKLPQSAIDILAIVAYHQPVTRQEVERIWQRPAGGVLSQLTQRNLLQIEQPDVAKKDRTYITTNRFLEILGLESLSDLPQASDVADVED